MQASFKHGLVGPNQNQMKKKQVQQKLEHRQINPQWQTNLAVFLIKLPQFHTVIGPQVHLLIDLINLHLLHRIINDRHQQEVLTTQFYQRQ
jgi:hypothetical protein